MTGSLISDMLVLATLAPLVSSFVIILLTRRVMFRAAGWFATAVMAGGFVCSLIAMMSWFGIPEGERHAIVWNVPWIPIPSLPGGSGGWLYLGAMVDSLTVAMMTMVTLISMLVHLYSIGYMKGDPRYNLFFAYLSLFTFSMMGIVISNSIMQLFVFWELVGLTSYLLIGFWYEKRGPQLACKKAFVMNRIGDAGFLIGFGILFYQLGGQMLLPAAMNSVGADGASITNMFGAVQAMLEDNGQSVRNAPGWLTAAGIGLFFGAIGKSAQFPLHTWLPDAMEGPTPVSSIVHSATMVAAGVYLTARIYPILTPEAHLFVATIGLITLVIAACMALVMTDIKRVLAYSTLSQLGYMILGLGAGAYAFALFHLITHAFFKCCLFQCSGSVINAAHHEQDMREYGGLGKKMPITMACYGVCTLAIAGASIPFTGIGISGFYSKDGIIAGTVNYGEALSEAGLGWLTNLYWLGPTVVAYLTVFYMARSFALTFLGEPRNRHLYDHAHEAPKEMVIPQIVLAAMAILTVPWIMGFWKDLIFASEPPVAWIQNGAVLEDHDHGMHMTHVYLLQGFAWILMLGAGLAIYRRGMAISSKIAALPGISLLYRWALNKFYFDALYDIFAVGLGKAIAWIMSVFDAKIVDGLVNFAGWLGRRAAWITGIFDDRVIDGIANGTASAAQGSGQALSVAQAGRLRGYVLLAVASAVAVLVVVVISAVVMEMKAEALVLGAQ